MTLLKYPRTRHIEGSRLQTGDLKDDKPIAELRDAHLTIEEKVDGANCAISFTDGQLMLQSRGHYLTGGYRERHFDMLKTWANVHLTRLQAVLGARYVMYGEWMYAKHTVFYDQLPHYFMEFDVYDRETRLFLSTAARRDLLTDLPIMPVPVVHDGAIRTAADINNLIKPSLYKSANWRDALDKAAVVSGSRADFVARQTEDSDLAEGLYIKVEPAGSVTERFKYVRHDFLQAIEASEGHWQDRPILPNQLAEGVDIFAPVLGVKGAYDETA
ncbi:RNA ligase family protein [Yoonia sp. R2-816]|uniref:RNA ligase family protein n=1 Tax=Yoonia sp. R2-816 TaxID=3342638 RepID=UPI00372AA510